MELVRRSSGKFHTSTSYEFKFQKANEKVKAVQFPAVCFCSPQFYYRDQKRFESKPRQIQAYCCGVSFFPIPMELPRFTEEQKRYAEHLRKSVRVGDIYVGRAEFQEYVRQATANNVVGETANRDRLRQKESIFSDEFRTTPEQAVERFDSTLNRTGSRLNRSFSRMNKSSSQLSRSLSRLSRNQPRASMDSRKHN